MSRDYYSILGVPRDASEAAIRERFRQLARERHPDRFRGTDKEAAEAEFQAVTEAFNVLMDPARRREHDGELAAPKSGASTGIDQEQLAKVYLQRGVRAYKAKSYRDAADNFDRATRATADNPQAWYLLALACSHEPRFQTKAREAIARACELASMNETYLRAAGRIYANAGDMDQAERYYNEALKWSANDPAIQAELEELKSSRSKGRFNLFGGKS
jgi:curved DNA-binding protein CbpA